MGRWGFCPVWAEGGASSRLWGPRSIRGMDLLPFGGCPHAHPAGSPWSSLCACRRAGRDGMEDSERGPVSPSAQAPLGGCDFSRFPVFRPSLAPQPSTRGPGGVPVHHGWPVPGLTAATSPPGAGRWARSRLCECGEGRFPWRREKGLGELGFRTRPCVHPFLHLGPFPSPLGAVRSPPHWLWRLGSLGTEWPAGLPDASAAPAL